MKWKEALHEDVLRRVAADRLRSHEVSSKGALTVSHVGDYVMVARRRSINKLTVIWTGSWRVVMQGEHVCTVDDQGTGQRLLVHAARMRPYADTSSDATKQLKTVIARTHGVEVHMADVNVGQLGDGS